MTARQRRSIKSDYEDLDEKTVSRLLINKVDDLQSVMEEIEDSVNLGFKRLEEQNNQNDKRITLLESDVRNVRDLHNRDIADIEKTFKRHKSNIDTLYKNRDAIAWAIISIVIFAGISFLIYQGIQ